MGGVLSSRSPTVGFSISYFLKSLQSLETIPDCETNLEKRQKLLFCGQMKFFCVKEKKSEGGNMISFTMVLSVLQRLLINIKFSRQVRCRFTALRGCRGASVLHVFFLAFLMVSSCFPLLLSSAKHDVSVSVPGGQRKGLQIASGCSLGCGAVQAEDMDNFFATSGMIGKR